MQNMVLTKSGRRRLMSKSDHNLEEELGASPWQIYEDRDEPWKDHELMLKLDEKFDYQYEVAHVLGTTPSKISYWMEKAEENWSPSLEDEKFECEYFEVCGYEAPNPESLCTTCLDLVRYNDSQRDKVELNGRELTDYVAELYDHYDDFETNSP